MATHHFYHCYADGAWQIPVAEHISALQQSGLYEQLDSFQIGCVGSASNVLAVAAYLDRRRIDYTCCASTTTGFEQETLDALYSFSQTHDGDVLYAHTKGASRNEGIDHPWRRSMTQKCVMEWRQCVEALASGKFIVGCHWIGGDPDIERLNAAWQNRHLNPNGHNGVGGMFGGNFWWTRLELLRQNCPPGHESRFAAEHWLGQLSEVMPINASTILDLNPWPITPDCLVPLQLAPS